MFDSDERDTLWRIMKHHRNINFKIRIVKKWYENNMCAVLDGSWTMDWSRVVPGVKQGCIIRDSERVWPKLGNCAAL